MLNRFGEYNFQYNNDSYIYFHACHKNNVKIQKKPNQPEKSDKSIDFI